MLYEYYNLTIAPDETKKIMFTPTDNFIYEYHQINSGINTSFIDTEGNSHKVSDLDYFENVIYSDVDISKYYWHVVKNFELDFEITGIEYTNSSKEATFLVSRIYTGDYIGLYNEQNIYDIYNLTYELNNTDIIFNYYLREMETFSHIELYQDGVLLVDNIKTNDFTVTNLDYDTNYEFTFYVIDTNGDKSSGVTRNISISKNPDLIPSGNIFNLTHTVSDKTVNFKYNLPIDDRFSHLKIYRDNELITDTYNLSEYTDRNLEPETEYEYRFVSVNKESILSNGYSVTVKTAELNDDIPPAIPTDLNVKGMNSGIMLDWKANNENDLKGYFIYVNGEKVNKSPISNNFYNLTNLNNDEEYTIQISSIDTFNNESDKSLSIIAIPSSEELPIFQLDTDLSSIAFSVENWFSEIWLLVAFATAIPLAFLIGSRIKSLFIA